MPRTPSPDQRPGPGVPPIAEPPIDFLLIAPLPEERDALLARMPGHRKLPPSDDDIRVYYAAKISAHFPDGQPVTYSAVVLPLAGMGHTQATSACGDAIRRFAPRYVLLVGIAGGIAKNGVSLGDLLLSDQVADYELAKITPAGASIRWQVHPVDQRLLIAAQNHAGGDLAETAATRPQPGRPRVHVGPVCTGNKVVADDSLADQLRDVWVKLIGVEMEAGGVANAVAQSARRPGFFMIRGVSDLADADKDSDDVKCWRPYACEIAAAWTLEWLKGGPVTAGAQLPSTQCQQSPSPAVGTREPAPTPAPDPSRPAHAHGGAAAILREKIDFLREQAAICSDPAQKFTLRKQIEEAEEELAGLSDPRSLVPAALPLDPSKLIAAASPFLDRGFDLGALLEAAREKGLLVVPVPVGTAGATGSLMGSAADATPLPDADLVDAVSQQIAKDLARIRERYLRGARTDAIAELDTLLAHRAWPHLAASLRGRLLRTAALYRLDFGQDLTGAEALAERATADDPDGDGQVLAAHLALRRRDKKAALTLLEKPHSAQAQHLKAAILIEDDDAEAALGILATAIEPPEGTTSDGAIPAEPRDVAGNSAETWRLRALAHLILKRLADAVEAIDAARALAPDWIAVSGAAAVVDFWRVCTPAALTLTEQPLWPMPFPRALVRAGGTTRLAEIERTFAAVADAMPAGSHEEGHWLTWRLLVLLAAGDRRDEATDLARRLIGEDGPLHVWPLLWSRFYDLDIDRVRLKGRLGSIPAADPNYIPLTGLYLELRLEDGEAEAVLAELEGIGPTVERLGHLEIPRQWRVLALTEAGRLGDAEAVADTIANEALRLRMRLHVARRQEAETPGSHKAAAAALLAADPGLDVLAEACDAHAKAGDWAFVAEHAGALLEAIPTPGSLRLLVIATFNRCDYPRCISALDEHRELYPDGRLPDDLALLRVRCQRELGEPSHAVRDAQALFDQAQTAEHLVELLNAQLAAANTPGILDALRRLTVIEPADGHLLLQGARIAAQLDRDLAIALWRRAVAHGQEDAPFVFQVATLGEGLGLRPEETGPWFQRITELAASGDGPVQTLHISEMPKFVRERREAVDQWLDKLWHGEIPLHVLGAGVLGPLPATLHANPEQNRSDPDPLKQPPILIRHGARPLGFPKPVLEPGPRLILDLTALITAQSLGLLDRLEKAFEPLWLHRHWYQLLWTEVEGLKRSQPRIAAVHSQMADLIRFEGLALAALDAAIAADETLADLVGEPVARRLEWARSRGGRLLTYLPLHAPDSEHWQAVALPSPWDEAVLGPRALLDGLLAEGSIDQERHRQGLESFPPEPESVAPRKLPPTDSVLLSDTMLLGQFAELGLLTALSHRFRLQVPAGDWERDMRGEEDERRRLQLADWTVALIHRVSAGVQAGRYRLLPAHGPEPDGSIPRHNGLDDLLSNPGEPGDRLWVDDRFINGFPSTDRTLIIGVVEVLDLLRKQGAIDRTERFELLHRLRAANYRFIPLDADEILHWLRQSHSESGRLVVPEKLEVLARHWAACLYQGDALQWTGNDRHRQGELPFFITSQSAVATVLCRIWSDDRLSLKRRQQRADWVFDNLYVGIGDIPHLGPDPNPERDMGLVGTDLAGLCSGAFQVMLGRIGRDRKVVDRDRKALKSAREHALGLAGDYLSWICSRVVAPRLLADPSSVGQTAATFRSLLLGSFARDGDDLLPSVGSWLLRFLPVLPTALRNELHKDQDLMQRLGLEQLNVIEVGDLHFRVHDFWPKVQEAMRGATPILQDNDQGEPFSLRLLSDEEATAPLLELADRSGKSVGRNHFQFSELFLDDRNQRLRALRRNPHWWDGDPRGVEGVERDLSVIDSAVLRVREIRRIMDRSADAHFVELEAEMQLDQRRERSLSLDRCFPPPLAAVLTYIRCAVAVADGESFAGQCWEALVGSIPDERGLVESLCRIALLPSPLPEGPRVYLAALDAEQLRDLLKKAASALSDPIGRLHLIDLLLAASEKLPEAMELAQEQIGHLVTPRFADEIALTLALVDLAYRAFGVEAEETGVDPRRQLLAAWVHAGRVAGIMLRGGAIPKRLANALRQWAPFPHRDLYEDWRESTGDLAWPWHVQVSDLVFAGLGRILSSYPALAPQLDLSALQERLARLGTGAPEPVHDAHLLRDSGLFTDTLGCLWGGDQSLNLAPLIGPEKASRFAPDTFAGLVDGWLEQLSVEPKRAESWKSLYVTVLHGTLPRLTAGRLDAILSRSDIDALIASDHLLLIPLMELAVRYCSDRESVIARIYRWSEGVDSGDQPPPAVREHFGDEATQKFCERLIHWLHGLAARDPEDPDGEFARLLDGLVLRSRTLAAELRGPLTSIAGHLPFSRHRALRRTLLAARARSAPAGGQTAPGGSAQAQGLAS
jgi:nucleoside phosphorylase/tetratricopeptide (TPR) repeat protein